MLEQFQAMITGSTQPYTLEKPKINECYIAYLDMLGYKAFFEENPDKIDGMLSVFTNAIEKMISYLQAFNSAFQLNTNIKDVYKIKIFSDNILMWIENNNSYETKFLLLAFLEVIKEFQINLIYSYGIFLRGGIIKGGFAANDIFVFGKGLIDVVDLEAKKAIFPRIIIHDSVIDDLNKKIPCNGSGACGVCKSLRTIDGLFMTSDKKELSDRIIRAYKTFADIISAVPLKYLSLKDKTELQNSLNRQANIVQYTPNINSEVLENVFQDAKALTPKMTNIFNNVLCNQITEYEKYCEIMMNGCFFRDEDGFAIINYLTPPSMLGLLTSEIIEMAISNMKILFPESSLNDEISVFTNHIKQYDHITEALTVHKKRVEDEVQERMMHYEKLKGNKERLHSNERVLKKYVWTIKYHNRVCEMNEKKDLKILYNISFEPIDDLLFVHIRQTEESDINKGVNKNG